MPSKWISSCLGFRSISNIYTCIGSLLLFIGVYVDGCNWSRWDERDLNCRERKWQKKGKIQKRQQEKLKVIKDNINEEGWWKKNEGGSKQGKTYVLDGEKKISVIKK